MARPDGPRAGALAFDGWDTHANERAAHGRLSVLLGALDGALAAIEGGGRDLKPTADLRAVMKGILRDHLRADELALARHVFPDSESVKSLDGLMT